MSDKNKEISNLSKVSILVKVARQVEGEYVFINIVKACSSAKELERFVEENKDKFPKVEKIDGIDCVLEYGIFTDILVDV